MSHAIPLSPSGLQASYHPHKITSVEMGRVPRGAHSSQPEVMHRCRSEEHMGGKPRACRNQGRRAVAQSLKPRSLAKFNIFQKRVVPKDIWQCSGV